MNTIRHPRKRPRKTSINFRTLGWLIRREAAWMIVSPAPHVRMYRERAVDFVRLTSARAERQARETLRTEPQRRYVP